MGDLDGEVRSVPASRPLASGSFSERHLSDAEHPGDADLACLEDGWDRDSPVPVVTSTNSSCSLEEARLCPKNASWVKRSHTMLSRRNDSLCVEKRDALINMLGAEGKFLPKKDSSGGRARCHSVSPYVAQRRSWFLEWKNQMASFFGYSRDTVAVALNYFDRFTCAQPCNPTTAQAVAATALHLAAKFEEIRPAPLQQLLKFTPVFSPDQLLMMELSMLKVLNWDLRPVTVYDFIRSICELIPLSRSEASPYRERANHRAKHLRTRAEELADLSACEACFLEQRPSTMATSALLLSASEKGSLGLQTDILHVCSAAGVDLIDVGHCVRVLGEVLSGQSCLIRSAAARVAKIVDGFLSDGHGDVADDISATSLSGKKREGPSSLVSKGSKARRCSTPTGVEGIFHIEMETIESGNIEIEATADSEAPEAGKARDGKRHDSAVLKIKAKRSLTADRIATSSVTKLRRATPTATRKRSGKSLTISHDAVTSETRAPSAQAPKQDTKSNIKTGGFIIAKRSELFTSTKKAGAEALGHCSLGSGFGVPALRGTKNDAKVRRQSILKA